MDLPDRGPADRRAVRGPRVPGLAADLQAARRCPGRVVRPPAARLQPAIDGVWSGPGSSRPRPRRELAARVPGEPRLAVREVSPTSEDRLRHHRPNRHPGTHGHPTPPPPDAPPADRPRRDRRPRRSAAARGRRERDVRWRRITVRRSPPVPRPSVVTADARVVPRAGPAGADGRPAPSRPVAAYWSPRATPSPRATTRPLDTRLAEAQVASQAERRRRGRRRAGRPGVRQGERTARSSHRPASRRRRPRSPSRMPTAMPCPVAHPTTRSARPNAAGRPRAAGIGPRGPSVPGRPPRRRGGGRGERREGRGGAGTDRARCGDSRARRPHAEGAVRGHRRSAERRRPGAAGSPLVRIADLSRWTFETSDLTRRRSPGSGPGAPVTVTVDGLPDTEVPAKVESIGDSAHRPRGEVTFRVVAGPDRRGAGRAPLEHDGRRYRRHRDDRGLRAIGRYGFVTGRSWSRADRRARSIPWNAGKIEMSRAARIRRASVAAPPSRSSRRPLPSARSPAPSWRSARSRPADRISVRCCGPHHRDQGADVRYTGEHPRARGMDHRSWAVPVPPAGPSLGGGFGRAGSRTAAGSPAWPRTARPRASGCPPAATSSTGSMRPDR